MTLFNEIQAVCSLLGAQQCSETRLKGIETELRARSSEALQTEYGRGALVNLTGCPNEVSNSVPALLTCSQGLRAGHTTLAGNLSTEFDRYKISSADRVLFGNNVNAKPTLSARVQFYQDSVRDWKAQAEQKEKDDRKSQMTRIGLITGGLLLTGAFLTLLVRKWMAPPSAYALPVPRAAPLRL
jgi:hypothetical protein